MDPRTAILTALALIAFASNSILTRLALGAHEIDAASFTLVRLASGAGALVLVVRLRAGSFAPLRGRSALGAAALLAYAAPFSFAYLRIGAAAGALVLFGVVQLTMIGYGIARGERPSAGAWLGLALAVSGLAALTIPAASRPDPLGVALMTVAGAAWGVYSLAGRSTLDPTAANARSFLWSVPLALLLVAGERSALAGSARGIGLAVVSGAVTSGLGYAVWYRVLPRLSVTQAAAAQLSVPVIAALAAAVFLGERLGVRFALCAAAILGGVTVVFVARYSERRWAPSPPTSSGPSAGPR